MFCNIPFKSGSRWLNRSVIGNNEFAVVRFGKFLNGVVEFRTNGNFFCRIPRTLYSNGNIIKPCSQSYYARNAFENAEIKIPYLQNDQTVGNIVIKDEEQFLFAIHLVHHAKSHVRSHGVFRKIERRLAVAQHKRFQSNDFDGIF